VPAVVRARSVRVAQLAPGVRALPGTVGYLGPPHSPARTLNVGDTIPGELSGCVWDGNAFRVNASGLAISNWRVNAGFDVYGSNVAISNCVINGTADSFYGVLFRGAGSSISDTTVTGQRTSSQSGEAVAYETGPASIIRCDLMGYQDLVGLSAGLISQCWLHDPALAADFHTDGIQIFGGTATIEHSTVDIRSPNGSNTNGIHQNACVYADLPSPVVHDVVVNNCLLAGGAFKLMWQTDSTGLIFTNNRFGPIDGTELGEYTIDSGPSGVALWSGNRHWDGSPANYP
jgi:hypothetical protein